MSLAPSSQQTVTMSSATKTTSSSKSEVLFTLKRKCGLPPTEDNESNEITENSNNINEVFDANQPDTIWCVLWKNSKLGAAYYNIGDKQIYVVQEMVDFAPEFGVTRSLYQEVNPLHIITMGSQFGPFVKRLINLMSNESEESTANSVQTLTLPPNLYLLPFKEYTFESCEHKIFEIKLASESENITNAQREVFMHSLIDFDSKLSVHALGALVKYVEKNWAHLNGDRNEELRYLHINQISLSNRVFMDRNTFNGLHVFHTRSHDARFKQGNESSNREGRSIFKLLSQYCKSKLGMMCLRNILMHPIKDLQELELRLDFIQFATASPRQGFIESLQDNIKKIFDVTTILGKIQNSRATSREWETLYNTIYHTLFFHELCGPYRASSELLRTLDVSVTTELYNLQHFLNSALDFTSRAKRNRPAIKFGLDGELDAKELRKQSIAKNITAAAHFAVNQLPEYLNECSVVYIPEMGHLIAVKEWEQDCDRNRLQEVGFEFVFEVNNLLHYKNAMCVELDRQLGNIHHDILAHENRIIQRLSDFVLKHNKHIREPLNIIALIDCLISMAKVAKERGYVRPQLNQNNIHEIEEGRHPLLELLSSNFVPNNYYSGGNHTHIKIITGPNDSGKSVYLKQTALIIFLAHIGSYVPAKSASISMVHSIHSRLHATESAGVNLSAFMLDLSQMSQALHNAKSTSLVILDEFGRGTTGDDGVALLVSGLKKFIQQEEFCPHVLVSTHLQQICHYLPQSQLISHMKLDHTMSNIDDLVFLYKVVEGISNSFAFQVAAATGLEQDIISRAREIYKSLFSNNTNNLLVNRTESNVTNLFEINIPEPDD